MRQLVQDLLDKTYTYRQVNRANKAPTVSELERRQIFGSEHSEDNEQPKYDPSKPLQFKFKVLEEYVKEYERLRNEGKEPIDIDPNYSKRRIINKE